MSHRKWCIKYQAHLQSQLGFLPPEFTPQFDKEVIYRPQTLLGYGIKTRLLWKRWIDGLWRLTDKIQSFFFFFWDKMICTVLSLAKGDAKLYSIRELSFLLSSLPSPRGKKPKVVAFAVCNLLLWHSNKLKEMSNCDPDTPFFHDPPFLSNP